MSQEKKYKSPSTNEPVTSAQYIAEILVQRKAKSQRKTLPYKFWNGPPWKKEFVRSIQDVSSYLKVFDSQAIIAALKRGKFQKAYSLRFPGLQDQIESEQQKLEKPVETIEVSEKTDKTPSKKFGKESTFSKLQ